MNSRGSSCSILVFYTTKGMKSTSKLGNSCSTVLFNLHVIHFTAFKTISFSNHCSFNNTCCTLSSSTFSLTCSSSWKGQTFILHLWYLTAHHPDLFSVHKYYNTSKKSRRWEAKSLSSKLYGQQDCSKLAGHRDKMGYPTAHKVAVSGHVPTHTIIALVYDFFPTENLLS